MNLLIFSKIINQYKNGFFLFLLVVLKNNYTFVNPFKVIITINERFF